MEEDANQTTTKAAHNKRHFSSFLLHTPAVKLEADFNPSMSGLLAREAGAAEQADRKRSRLRKALIARSPMCAVIDLTTLRERKTTSERACVCVQCIFGAVNAHHTITRLFLIKTPLQSHTPPHFPP